MCSWVHCWKFVQSKLHTFLLQQQFLIHQLNNTVALWRYQNFVCFKFILPVPLIYTFYNLKSAWKENSPNSIYQLNACYWSYCKAYPCKCLIYLFLAIVIFLFKISTLLVKQQTSCWRRMPDFFNGLGYLNPALSCTLAFIFAHTQSTTDNYNQFPALYSFSIMFHSDVHCNME